MILGASAICQVELLRSALFNKLIRWLFIFLLGKTSSAKPFDDVYAERICSFLLTIVHHFLFYTFFCNDFWERKKRRIREATPGEHPWQVGRDILAGQNGSVLSGFVHFELVTAPLLLRRAPIIAPSPPSPFCFLVLNRGLAKMAHYLEFVVWWNATSRCVRERLLWAPSCRLVALETDIVQKLI